MEEDHARLPMGHVLMNGADVDVAFARSTIVAACPGDALAIIGLLLLRR